MIEARRWIGLPLLGVAVLAPCAAAQSDESLLIESASTEKMLKLDGTVLLFPSAKLEAPGAHSGFWESSSEGRLRLDNSHELNPVIGYSYFEVGPGSGFGPVDGNLIDFSMAFSTPLGTIGDWYVGVRAGAGYAGDHPFSNGNAWYGMASVSAGRKFGNGDALLLWVDYNGNRTLLPDVPLPHAAYSHALNPKTDIVLGLPESSIEYRPDPKLTLSLTYDAPTSVDASVQYAITDWLTATCAYKDDIHAFRSSELAEPDRVFFEEQHVEASLRWRINDDCSLSLLAGYGFQCSFSTGFDDRDKSRLVGVSDGAFVGVQAVLGF